MELMIDQHKGMSVLIAPEKLPPYMYQTLKNLELSRKLGRMYKRDGYKNIITEGLTTLKSMIEFTDRGGTRRLFLQDGTYLLGESVYSGGYGDVVFPIPITRDMRWLYSDIDKMFPVLFNNEIRGGVGILGTANNYVPVWYGYIDETIRFPNSGSPVTIAAETYLDFQFYNDRVSNLISYFAAFNAFESKVAGVGALKGRYVIYVCPVLDGYQRGFPDINVIDEYSLPLTNGKELAYDYGSLSWYIEIMNVDKNLYKRITALDFFIAEIGQFGSHDSELYPAYFLERVPLDDDGAVICELTGNLETANPPTYIEFDKDFSEWETFLLTGFHASFSASQDYVKVLGARTENGTKVRYGILGLVNADSGLPVTMRIFSRWFENGGHYFYHMMFDNYYRKLGSEMYSYLNIPTADMGVATIPKYKYGVMSNKRYFIFGMAEGPYGYYSVVGSPDIIPAQNIIRFKHEPTGGCAVGNDIMIFSQNGAERYTILGNASSEKDDEFSNIGLTGQQALFKISDEEVYGFDLRGPWHLKLRQHYFIGQHLKEWWTTHLSDAQKAECVVQYNRLKDWVLYSFPTFSGTVDNITYANGIVFVFDREATNFYNNEVWWILDTDTELYCGSIAVNDDLHLLTGSRTKIVDWNHNMREEQDELVSYLAHLKILKNQIFGNKTYYKRLFIDMQNEPNFVARIRTTDEFAQIWTTLSINTNDQAFIRFLADSLELQIYNTADGQSDEYFNSFLFDLQPRQMYG